MMRFTYPRFRLRTLLGLFAVASVALAVYGTAWRSRERQYAVAVELAQLGVRARSQGLPRWGLRPEIDYVEIDEHLGLKSNGLNWAVVPRPPEQKLTSADVARLAAFPALRKLHLQGNVIEPTAIAEIAKLTSLEELVVVHFPLNDEQFLSLGKLTHLRDLTLEATEVTDGAIDRLREQLPDLQVYDD